MWDSTDYWSKRFTSKEVFEQIAAIPSNDFAWMQQELQWFFESPAERAQMEQYWATANENVPTDFDLGDYTSVNVSFAPFLPFSGAYIWDDYGNDFLSISVGVGTPGVSVTRKDISINGIDIDNLGLSNEERATLSRETIAGPSRGLSVDYIFLEASIEYGVATDTRNVFAGGGVTISPAPGGFLSLLSLTWER